MNGKAVTDSTNNHSCNREPIFPDVKNNGVAISVSFCESESHSDIRSAILELLTNAYEQRLRGSV